MLNGNGKSVELAVALLHIGGLSGSASFITSGQLVEALLCAIIASMCVLILTGAVGLSEIVKIKVKAFAARHGSPPTVPPEVRNEDNSSEV